MEATLRALDWVGDVQVRLREEGHVFVGAALAVPTVQDHLTERIDAAATQSTTSTGAFTRSS